MAILILGWNWFDSYVIRLDLMVISLLVLPEILNLRNLGEFLIQTFTNL